MNTKRAEELAKEYATKLSVTYKNNKLVENSEYNVIDEDCRAAFLAGYSSCEERAQALVDALERIENRDQTEFEIITKKTLRETAMRALAKWRSGL
jgi:hypothetical protein